MPRGRASRSGGDNNEDSAPPPPQKKQRVAAAELYFSEERWHDGEGHEWREKLDDTTVDDGGPRSEGYYWNVATKKVAWERPEGCVASVWEYPDGKGDAVLVEPE